MAVKRVRASSRREEILTATVDVITDVGHQNVRVADVAKKLDVSASLIIYHFATKEELVAQAFRFAAENDLLAAKRVASTTKDPIDRFFRLAAWYAPTESSRSWTLWIDGWAAGMRNPKLSEMLAIVDREWKQLMIDALTEAVEQGQIKPVDPLEVAVKVMAFADGLAVSRVMQTADLSVAIIADWVQDLCRSALGLSSDSQRDA